MDTDEAPLAFGCQSTLSRFPCQIVPSTARLQVWKQQLASNVWARHLDRVNVLGSDASGHTGCVNALSWARHGELLLSSGDDQQLRVWRMDHSLDAQNEYPFASQTVIDTGHTANVFNAHMLPSSTRIATVAGDRQVRVFDVGESVGRSPSGNEISYSTRQACIRVLRCHSDRTKRIVTEDSPDFFLTVAEDGEVRQHDLRTQHSCSGGCCPAPLVKLPHDLSTIALSPLTPYHFVVGGESPFAHLFDRRQVGRCLREEWGMSPAVDDLTTCVRRFSRQSRAPGEAKGCEHITGARMSAWNGHELLLSYNSDAVYLYSTRDEPGAHKDSCILPPNSDKKRDVPSKVTSRNTSFYGENVEEVRETFEEDEETGMEVDDSFSENEDDDMTRMADCNEPDDDDEDDGKDVVDAHSEVPVVYPRMRFSGHCNVETVKDVNFLGPCDEYVTSGSDDGNFFIWKKSTGEVVDVLEGDGSVVNVIEGHPTLPLVAVSGIDTTIKLFAPTTRGPATYSKSQNAASIMKQNALNSRRSSRAMNLMWARFVMQHRARALEILRDPSEDESSEVDEAETRLAHCIDQ